MARDDVATKVAWRLLTTLIVSAIAAAGADFQHFTWWSIAWWALYGMLEEVDLGPTMFWLFMSLQILVITGVVIMGATDCDVFEEAFESLGATGYIVGNFAMHYLPSLTALALADERHLFCGGDSATKQIWAAFGLFLIWHHLKDPWDVYGCSLPHTLGVTGMLIITLSLTLAAYSVATLEGTSARWSVRPRRGETKKRDTPA